MEYEKAKYLLEELIKKLPANDYETKFITSYEYWGKVERVVDGDTIDLNVSMGFNVFSNIRVRLLGVNTPEIYGVKQDSDEYKNGQKSFEFVKSLLKNGDWVEIKIKENIKEKYGRWIGIIYIDDKCLNTLLIQKGYYYQY